MIPNKSIQSIEYYDEKILNNYGMIFLPSFNTNSMSKKDIHTHITKQFNIYDSLSSNTVNVGKQDLAVLSETELDDLINISLKKSGNSKIVNDEFAKPKVNYKFLNNDVNINDDVVKLIHAFDQGYWTIYNEFSEAEADMVFWICYFELRTFMFKFEHVRIIGKFYWLNLNLKILDETFFDYIHTRKLELKKEKIFEDILFVIYSRFSAINYATEVELNDDNNLNQRYVEFVLDVKQTIIPMYNMNLCLYILLIFIESFSLLKDDYVDKSSTRLKIIIYAHDMFNQILSGGEKHLNYMYFRILIFKFITLLVKQKGHQIKNSLYVQILKTCSKYKSRNKDEVDYNLLIDVFVETIE